MTATFLPLEDLHAVRLHESAERPALPSPLALQSGAICTWYTCK